MLPAAACGKIILFGEHAVVYGHPALAMGIPTGIKVTGIQPCDGPIRIRVSPWDLEASGESDGVLGEVLRRLSRLVPGERLGMEVDLESRIPPAAGMGSSAALAVALVRCLARVRGVQLGDEQVRALAHELESVFHGRPSGLDDTVATYGGLCLFKLDGFGNSAYRSITDQAVRVPFGVPTLVVGDTKVQRSTAHMVAGVRRQWEDDAQRVEALFEEVDSCLADGMDALEQQDSQGLGNAMSRNQDVLGRLGLSCPQIDEMIALAGRVGASGAKLTGAGGGGGVVAVAPDREEELEDTWRSAGFDAWKVSRNPT